MAVAAVRLAYIGPRVEVQSSFDCHGELQELAVADHLAELLLGFEHPGGCPARPISPEDQCLTLRWVMRTCRSLTRTGSCIQGAAEFALAPEPGHGQRLRPTTSSTSSSIIELSTPSPTRALRANRPFLRCPHQLAGHVRYALREHGLIAGRLRDPCAATHGGSSFELGRSPGTLRHGADRPAGTAVTSEFHEHRDKLCPWLA